MGVVLDKITRQHLLDDGMAAVFNVYSAFFVEGRADIAVALRGQGEAAEHVQQRHGARGLLDLRDLLSDGVPDLAEAVIFQIAQLLLRVENGVLQFLQARRRVALGADQCLFADVIVRHEVFKGIRNVKIIAEDLVVLDFQIFDAGPLPV